MPAISGNVGAVFNGGTITQPASIIGNAGAGALLYLESDDAASALALEVGGGGTGDLLIVVADNAVAGHSRTIVATGFVLQRANAAVIDANLATGDLSLWFDQTAGAAKLMVKAKDAGGTYRTGSLALT